MINIEKLKSENDDLKAKLHQLSQTINASNLGGQSGGDQMTIKHIKGTLLQFLKNCPMTDRNNEELLKIIFGMMEFTPEEVSFVQEQRLNTSNNNKKNPSSRAHSVSSGGPSGTEPEEEGKKKSSGKGILSIFSRKSASKDKRGNTTGDDINSNITSPAKPMAPIRRH